MKTRIQAKEISFVKAVISSFGVVAAMLIAITIVGCMVYGRFPDSLKGQGTDLTLWVILVSLSVAAAVLLRRRWDRKWFIEIDSSEINFYFNAICIFTTPWSNVSAVRYRKGKLMVIQNNNVKMGISGITKSDYQTFMQFWRDGQTPTHQPTPDSQG